VLSELRGLGLAEQGTIAIETFDTAISTAARAAAGSPADAVVWEEVESRTSESAELSGSFLAFMVLATLIAGVGTTIPAAANVGVAAAYRDWYEFGGAIAQLGINLIAIVIAGVATLAIQRAFYLRRMCAARPAL
jgi:hypothetical protein